MSLGSYLPEALAALARAFALKANKSRTHDSQTFAFLSLSSSVLRGFGQGILFARGGEERTRPPRPVLHLSGAPGVAQSSAEEGGSQERYRLFTLRSPLEGPVGFEILTNAVKF